VNIKILKEIFSGVSLAAILLLFVFFVTFAWTNPTQVPPGGSGGVRIDGDGNVGISASTSFDPEFKLDIDFEGVSSDKKGFRAEGISTFTDKLGIGLKNSVDVKAKLHVSSGSILQNNPIDTTVISGFENLKGTAIPNNASRIAVYGKLAFLTFFNSGSDQSKKFRILDVADPRNPKVIGGENITDLPTCASCQAIDVAVAGRFAYITFNGQESDAFRVIDVSNPSNPIVVGGTDLKVDMPMQSPPLPPVHPIAVYVSGRYAYITFNSPGPKAFRIIDISDPTKPEVVGGKDLKPEDIPIAANYGIHVNEKYAYFNLGCESDISCSNGGFSFRILDISEPFNPIVVGTTLTPSLNKKIPTSVPIDIYVSGNHAYISLSGDPADGMMVVDVSNPVSPKVVGNLSYAPGIPIPSDVVSFAIGGAGNYAYLGFGGASQNALRIIDISDPTNPTAVGGAGGFMSDLPSNNSGIDVAGRYVYMTFASQSIPSQNGTFRIIDPTGVEAISGSIHALETGSLQVRENAMISNNLEVKGALNIGGGILNSSGAAIGGDLFIKTSDSQTGIKSGGIKILVKETLLTCDAACGSVGPTDCLSAFDNTGQNISCDSTVGTKRRCLCAVFGVNEPL
jgi:hypothetical protein